MSASTGETEALTHRIGLDWIDQGRRVVAATLVEVDGSAPMPVGGSMLVASAGNIEGSVTGGCVEAAIAVEAEGIFAGGPSVVAPTALAISTRAGWA